jgi:hypothetical protein
MTDIITRLRERAPELANEIIAHIDELNERIRNQHGTMDKAASIMLEATLSEDGIDSELADECIDQIRGLFTEIGKTTVEHYQGLIYAKVAEIAGIPPDDEFNIMDELDKLGEPSLGLKWAMSVLWAEGKPGSKWGGSMTTGTGCGCCGDQQSFPPGTTWQQALRVIVEHEAAIAAGAVKA